MAGTLTSPDDPGVQQQVVVLLREHGLRATLPRRSVLSVLVASDRAEEHVSVEAILERLAGSGPDVSTIYRTLASLTDTGMVHQTRGEGGAALYRLIGGHAAADHHHAHLRCRVCGRVLDVPRAMAEPLRASLAAEGFTLDLAHTVLVGTCADCTVCTDT